MIEEFLFNYCPWIDRVWLILCWLGEIVKDQVNPGLSTFLHHPTNLWPGWDWAQMNALYSSRAAPWNLAHRKYLTFLLGDDDDDDF